MTFLSKYADMTVMPVSPVSMSVSVHPVIAGSNFQHVKTTLPVKLAETCLGITTAKQTPRVLSQQTKTIVAAHQEGIWARQSSSTSELRAGLDKTLLRWWEGSGDRDKLNLGRWSIEFSARFPEKQALDKAKALPQPVLIGPTACWPSIGKYVLRSHRPWHQGSASAWEV